MQVPVLAIKQPWAGLIAANFKTAEIRDFPAPRKYGGQKIAIYASRTKPAFSDQLFATTQYQATLPPSCSNLGHIIATATIDAFFPLSWIHDFSIWRKEHRAPDAYFHPGKTHIWLLGEIQALKKPVPFKMPQGAVVWSSIEETRLNEGL